MLFKIFIASLSFLLLHNYSAFAQFKLPPLSGKGKVVQQVGYTSITIEYERPSARGRKIFGGLVPWNKVWRTGAGPCTKIHVSDEVQIGKQRIPAGSYSLHSIPNPDEWVIIINSDTSLYGSYDYDIQKDVARFSVPVHTSSRYYETLTFDIDLVPNNARIYLSWENISLQFDLKTQTDQQAITYIKENLMTGKVKDPEEYALAADYLVFQGENLQDALTLANKSFELGGQGYAIRLKMELLERFMRYEEAMEAAKAGLEYAKVRPLDDEKWRAEGVRNWEASIRRIQEKIDK